MPFLKQSGFENLSRNAPAKLFFHSTPLLAVCSIQAVNTDYPLAIESVSLGFPLFSSTAGDSWDPKGTQLQGMFESTSDSLVRALWEVFDVL